jgi:hypothetical protein
MISGRGRLLGWIVYGTVILWLTARAEAVYIDTEQTLKVSGKLQTRASLRLQDSEGFTYPLNVFVGNLVQWRNLALLEVDHDLRDLTDELDILYPLKALKIRSKYHIVGRFMYEAVYNVGPQAFQDVRDADKENIDNFKQSYDLWECYVDLSRGPLFFRFGRQSLSWGETDVFRLLDSINPLDNTFGGPFEDLDDRRIPLWMLRGSYNLGNVGPVKSLGLEAFWVPGMWDARISPWAPKGTPYSAPLAEELARFLSFKYPDKSMDSSRWGFRLQGVVGPNLNLSVGHYRTFLDLPALRAVVEPGIPLLTSLDQMAFEVSWQPVHITGGSLNYWEPRTNTVVRAEVAFFWDEPVFIPQENISVLYGPTLPLPGWALDLAADLFGIDIRDLGLDGLPVNPRSGTIPEKNILRYMIGLDKQVWIRPLNRTNMFFVSLQYFGQWIPDYDERLRQALQLYPSPVNFAVLKEIESVFTALVSTMYRKGTINPQLALAYDVRGAWLIQPSVNLIREPFRFMIQYSAIQGNFTNFGAFRDRDQITFILTYLLS